MITIQSTPAEVVNYSRAAEHVFNRYGVNLDSNEPVSKTVNEPEFVTEILNCFSDDKIVSVNQFSSFPALVLIDYLERSHKYYIEKRLPEIGQTIWELSRSYNKNHPLLKLLSDFYCFYRNDLEKHFFYEEKYLFPYAKLLHNAINMNERLPVILNYISQYSIDEFINQHNDTEIELKEVHKALRKYEPVPDSRLPYQILLEKLNVFEQDLHIHATIEDEVLVPKLIKMETKLKAQLN